MVIRDSHYPRLPRTYWGELIYATPGCGKTYVANKYRDVFDGDELIVEAIREEFPNYIIESYDDPRKVIFRFFRYINFASKSKWRVYHAALDKMYDAKNDNDVVLFGTLDLIHEADRIFLERDGDFVRNGFEEKQDREEMRADEVDAPVHHIYEYLDNSLQRAVH